MKTITIIRAQHAVLYERFDLNASGFVKVGDRQGHNAPEDSATGAEYRCLGFDGKGNKVAHSSDYRCGYFYPFNTFIYGCDGNNLPLSFQFIEEFVRKFRNCNTQRAMLPNGWNNGMTWYNALYYSPVDFQPLWMNVPEIVKQKFPAAEICESQNVVEVFLED